MKNRYISLYILAVTIITASCQSEERSQSNAMEVRAVSFAAAIERVSDLAKARECIFVVDDELIAEIERQKKTSTKLVARSHLSSFPVQKSSDAGILYYDVTIGKIFIQGNTAEVSVRFYIGVDNAAYWRVNLSRQGGAWRSESVRITARS